MTVLAVRTERYRKWLLDELTDRKSRNPLYSLRAFARDLNVGKTALSDVLAGKRNFSRQAALQVSEKLAWGPRRTKIVLEEIQSRTKAIPLSPKSDSIDLEEYLQIREDQFKLISDWYYIGILTLARLRNARADSDWIAKRLGISELQARAALDALERLGLIELKNGKLTRTTLPIATASKTPSPAIRNYHRQNLRLAEQTLEQVAMSKRIFSAISITVDPTKTTEAEALINEFKQKFADLMDGGPRSKEVYTLSIQFFPITKEIDHE